ncbi:hypothetical protein EDC04DRAFT_3099618 [Pisolithus marmoratus]|nr:hypothetical protein EDC04DRAFT_3099618 [Pisolithus marmoratus]
MLSNPPDFHVQDDNILAYFKTGSALHAFRETHTEDTEHPVGPAVDCLNNGCETYSFHVSNLKDMDGGGHSANVLATTPCERNDRLGRTCSRELSSRDVGFDAAQRDEHHFGTKCVMQLWQRSASVPWCHSGIVDVDLSHDFPVLAVSWKETYTNYVSDRPGIDNEALTSIDHRRCGRVGNAEGTKGVRVQVRFRVTVIDRHLGS